MKTIVNKTRRPLKIMLSQGKALHLGPAKEGRIGTHDAERENVKQLVAAGDVDVFDDASRHGARGAKGSGGAAPTEGPHRQFSGSKRGDR